MSISRPTGEPAARWSTPDDPRCIEIWNLVFIQFNADADGTFSPLPQRHVDTGMGFERVTAIIQGTKNLTDFTGTISNYETDVFRPIFDEIEKLSGKRYGSTLPESGSAGDTEQEKIDVAFRVIADHIRTLSFAIADGIQPSNEGRGYVLRRILRRAVRYGRSLGFHEPFFYQLVDVLARTMGNVFPELRDKADARFEETLTSAKRNPSTRLSIKASLSFEDRRSPLRSGEQVDDHVNSTDRLPTRRSMPIECRSSGRVRISALRRVGFPARSDATDGAGTRASGRH